MVRAFCHSPAVWTTRRLDHTWAVTITVYSLLTKHKKVQTKLNNRGCEKKKQMMPRPNMPKQRVETSRRESPFHRWDVNHLWLFVDETLDVVSPGGSSSVWTPNSILQTTSDNGWEAYSPIGRHLNHILKVAVSSIFISCLVVSLKESQI